MKKTTLLILLLFSILSFGQTATVTVTDLKVKNLAATTVNFGTNVTSVNVSITASVNSSYNISQGAIAVYYKRNSSTSTTPIIPTNGYDGNFVLSNGFNGTKTFTVTLSRSEFDNTGGVVYVEYQPSVTSLLKYKSSNINVTKISDPISNNTLSGNQTIYEGQSASTISGSTPFGGDGTFIYSWQQKVGNGSWTTISGANGINYSPNILTATTSYRRIVSSAAFTVTGTSNEVIVTVVPAPIIQNNTITIDGVIVYGSAPTGGLGDPTSYYYSWLVIDQDGDASDLSYTSPNVIFSQPEFARYLKSPNNFKLTRIVYSGSQRSFSNYVDIPHISDIQNNIISINGNNVTGSVPTGGMGDYTYSWAIYYTGDAIDFDETTKDLDLTSHLFQINTILQIDSSAKLVRVVTAGISSTSNKLALNSITTTSLNNASTATIYPNPTSDSVNFATSSSSNQEMEIIIYSEKSGNPQSVFKGTAAPNQNVKWNIPSNYPKGIYFYKIISDNKEVKSGKILYQ